MRGKLKLLHKSYICITLCSSRAKDKQMYKMQEFPHEFYEMKQIIA